MPNPDQGGITPPPPLKKQDEQEVVKLPVEAPEEELDEPKED